MSHKSPSVRLRDEAFRLLHARATRDEWQQLQAAVVSAIDAVHLGLKCDQREFEAKIESLGKMLRVEANMEDEMELLRGELGYTRDKLWRANEEFRRHWDDERAHRLGHVTEALLVSLEQCTQIVQKKTADYIERLAMDLAMSNAQKKSWKMGQQPFIDAMESMIVELETLQLFELQVCTIASH